MKTKEDLRRSELKLQQIESHSKKIQRLRELQHKSFIMKNAPEEYTAELSDTERRITILKNRVKRASPFSSYYLSYLVHSNPAFFAFLPADLLFQFIYHPLNTIKVRAQAESKLFDVARFHQNRVKDGSIFAAFRYSLALSFLNVSGQYSFFKLYDRMFPELDTRKLDFLVWVSSDMLLSPLRFFFETRRSQLQMLQTHIPFEEQMRFLRIGAPAMILRDLTYRAIFTSSMLNFDHSPNKLNINAIFASAFIAGIFSQPFDTAYVRLVTQRMHKYPSVFSTISLTRAEEGFGKLMVGFSQRFFSILLLSIAQQGLYHALKRNIDNAFSLENLTS